MLYDSDKEKKLHTENEWQFIKLNIIQLLFIEYRGFEWPAFANTDLNMINDHTESNEETNTILLLLFASMLCELFYILQHKVQKVYNLQLKVFVSLFSSLM